MNHKWTCLSYFSKSGDSFMLICAQFSSHSLFEGQCGRTLIWALFFHQYKQRQQVPDGTQPWPHHFYTLSHWPNGLRQWNISDVKRIYSCLDIFGIWLLSGIATKSSDFNLPSKDKKWFQENQGDELLGIQFISCHPSWHLHLSSSTAENQRLVVLPLKNSRRKP